MDLGVGSFVFSQGVVSAIPLLKDPSHLCKPLFLRLVQISRQVAPVAGLGLIRLIAVKGADYPVGCALSSDRGEFIVFLGTCDGVWSTLELFPDTSCRTYSRSIHTSSNSLRTISTPGSLDCCL